MTDGKVKKVVLAYSGGLDTSVIVPWLRNNYDNCEVVCFTADVGQQEDFDAVSITGPGTSLIGESVTLTAAMAGVDDGATRRRSPSGATTASCASWPWRTPWSSPSRRWMCVCGTACT